MLFPSHGIWRSCQDGVMNDRGTDSAVRKNELDWEQRVNKVNDAGRDYLQV